MWHRRPRLCIGETHSRGRLCHMIRLILIATWNYTAAPAAGDCGVIPKSKPPFVSIPRVDAIEISVAGKSFGGKRTAHVQQDVAILTIFVSHEV